jgi:hypothetical protein
MACVCGFDDATSRGSFLELSLEEYLEHLEHGVGVKSFWASVARG